MQIESRHLENCPLVQKAVSVSSCDVESSNPQLCTIFCIGEEVAFAFISSLKVADSGTYSDKIDEEHACESFSIRPYQFEQRVSSDEAVSNPEDLGDKCMASDEETNVILRNSDWYVVRVIR